MEAHSSSGDLALEKPKILEGIVLSRNAQRFIPGKIDPGGKNQQQQQQLCCPERYCVQRKLPIEGKARG